MSAAEIFDLHGKVALVTGASSELGVRFAQCLAENGAAVALVSTVALSLPGAETLPAWSVTVCWSCCARVRCRRDSR